MAVLVLGLAGAAILGPIGLGITTAGTGWLIGSTIGNLIGGGKNTTTEGPRLTDLSVQASSYGGAIPVVYGSYRVSGNVIFCTNLREVITTTTTRRGKGGGPKNTNKEYTYNCDIGIVLCDNEISTIRKIFSNGKLVFDASTGANISTVLSSSIRAKGIKVYLGTETQMPDPTMEASTGAGLSPAYRGVAYIVFNQLDCPQGRIPQLSFEVLQSSQPAAYFAGGVPQPFSYDTAGTGGVPTFRINHYLTDAVNPMLIPKLGAGFNVSYVSLGIGPFWTEKLGVSNPSVKIDVNFGAVEGVSDINLQCMIDYPASGVSGKVRAVYDNGETQILFPVYPLGDGRYNWWQTWTKYDDYIVFLDTVFDGSTNKTRLHLFQWSTQKELVVKNFTENFVYVFITSNYVWLCRDVSTSVKIIVLNISDLSVFSDTEKIFVDGGGRFSPLSNNKLAFIRNQTSIIGGASTGVNILFEINTSGVYTTLATDSNASANNSFFNNIIRGGDGRSFALSGLKIYSLQITGVGGYNYTASRVVYDMGGTAPSAPTLASIITSICIRAGLSAGQIDVSELTDTVQGFAITGVTSARANLDPLLKTFFIDTIKSNGQIKFRPRASQTAVATINFDELGCVQDGSAPGEPLALQRTQEDDLPRSLAISFINYGADYQVGTEKAKRTTTTSINDVTEQIAVVMSADRGATVANALLYDAWAGRNKRSAKVSRKFAALDAGDVISVEYPRNTFRPQRITRASIDGVTCDLELVDYEGAIYTVQAVGSTVASGQAGIALGAPTSLQLLDMPILRDADDNAGLYAALAPVATGWTGAALFVGRDEATLEVRGTVLAPGAVIGFADSPLGDWQNGGMDEAHTVLVTIAEGDLYNATRDDVLNSNANAALLGNEVICFTRATLISGKQYRLSGLMRGLRGTEGDTASHTGGERFVLLQSDGLTRVRYDVAEIGSPRKFKAVSAGQSPDALLVTYTNTAIGLRPFSPSNVRANRLPNGDIQITWDRRTRYAENWLLGSTPLGELTEAYEIEISIGAANLGVIRTLKTTTSQAFYTLAQQYADRGQIVLTTTVRVYQMSTDYGRGRVGESVITVGGLAAGSAFPGGQSNSLSLLTKAGGNVIAVASSSYGGTIVQKIFESADDGVNFTQTPSGSDYIYPKGPSAGLNNGVYVNVNRNLLNPIGPSGLNDVRVLRGIIGSAPVQTAFQFTKNTEPIGSYSDGNTIYFFTRGRTYNTNDGIVWNFQDFSTYPSFFSNNIYISKVDSRYFSSTGNGGASYTDNSNLHNGWTNCIMNDNSTAPLKEFAFKNAFKSGLKIYSNGYSRLSTGLNGQIYSSLNNGLNWDLDYDTNSLYGLGNLYVLNGTLIYLYDSGNKTLVLNSSGAWVSYTNNLSNQRIDGAIVSNNTLIVSDARIPAVNDSPINQFKYSTDGITFTNSNGV